MEKKIFIAVFLLILMSSFAFAETIILKSGQKHEGKIVERTDEYIKIDIGVGMPVTYFLDEIEKIDKDLTITTRNENIYINEEYGISLVFPQNWHVYEGGNLRKTIEIEAKLIGSSYSDYEKSNEKILVKVFKDPYGSPGKINPNIIVSTIDIHSLNMTVNHPLDYLSAILPYFQAMKNFSLLQEPKTLMINNSESAKMVYEQNLLEDLKLRTTFLCFIKNSRVMIFSFTSLGDEEDESIFDEVIKSINIKDEKD
ncbi:MAG: hypothetical protein FJZ10_03495 [Candidatus Omnitrophica bacterium]|nr:hypothetical protein [Candidatus Omnitrophota bacterium]